jgi:hypothetical protein
MVTVASGVGSNARSLASWEEEPLVAVLVSLLVASLSLAVLLAVVLSCAVPALEPVTPSAASPSLEPPVTAPLAASLPAALLASLSLPWELEESAASPVFSAEVVEVSSLVVVVEEVATSLVSAAASWVCRASA